MPNRKEARIRLAGGLDAGCGRFRNLSDMLGGVKMIRSGVMRMARSVNPIYRARAKRYLSGDGVKKLQIGAGPQPKPGWLNTDLKPLDGGIVYLDARAPLKFPDDSFDFAFAEHLIEHLDFLHGLRLLSECRRILKPGGVLRLATPDLNRYLRLLEQGDEDAELQRYVEWYNQRFVHRGGETYGEGAIFPFNSLFRNFGHMFIYTPERLRESLVEAGFSHIEQVRPTESRHAELQGLETHDPGNAEFMHFETMVFEATK